LIDDKDLDDKTIEKIASSLSVKPIELKEMNERISCHDTSLNIILNNDYLDFVEIVMLLEEEFNVEIDETLTEEINTPNKIIKCVLNKLKC
jgi:acyl carrier protein